MVELDALKDKIKELETQIAEERASHMKHVERIKSENYDALEASQTCLLYTSPSPRD